MCDGGVAIATGALLGSTRAAIACSTPTSASVAIHADHRRTLVELADQAAAAVATDSPPISTVATTLATTSSWYCRRG